MERGLGHSSGAPTGLEFSANIMFGVENIMSNGLALKSLQEKVSLTLFVVMGALAVVSYVTLHEIVAPTFDRLEYE